MSGYCGIQIVGNLGKDPELKDVAGDQVCNFSVAVNQKRKSEEVTDWYRVDVWGKSAAACAQFLKKGSKVMVHGSLNPRTYDNKGVQATSLDVRASQVVFLDSKPTAEGEKSWP